MLSEFKKKGRRMIVGNGNSANLRMRNQRVLLLLALAAAVLGVTLLHKLREGRIYGLLLQDRDRQVVALQLVLQREREKWRDTKWNLEDRRAKIFILKNQKMELANKLSESKQMVDHLRRTRDEMEATLSEKQYQINMLSAKAQESSTTTNLQAAALAELLKQKEAQVEEMKQRLAEPTPTENNPTARDESTGELPSSGGEREVGNAKGGTPTEGKWVKFQTNYQENESSEEGHEVSQASTTEIKEQSEDEVSQVSTTEVKEHSEDEVSQVSTTEIKEQSEVEVGQVSTTEVKEQSEDGVSQVSTTEIKEQSEDGVSQVSTGVSQVSTTEVKEQSEDGVSQVSTTEIQELQASDGNASEKLEKLGSSQDGIENQAVPEETKMGSDGEETKTRHGRRNRRRTKRRRKSTSRSGRDLERESEKNGTPVLDEGLKSEDQTSSEGRPEGTTEEGLDDSNQQVSDTENQEGAGSVTESDTAVPNDTPSEEVPKTDGQGSSEGNNTEGATTEERRDDGNQQLPDTRNQEGDESAKDAESDTAFPNDTPLEEVSKTDGQGSSEGNNTEGATTEERRDEVINEEEEEDAKIRSNIEQAEVQNNGNEHQSQIPENTMDATGESSVGELKEAENQNSEDTA